MFLCWICACPAPAAELTGSHHDLGIYFEKEQGECGYCHRPHRAESPNYIFNRKAPDMGIGIVGNFCFTFCHDGTAFPGGVIVSPTGEVGINVLLKSHGLKRGNFSRSRIETVENMRSSGLPYIGSPEESLMQCSTCHQVHSNRYPPFLRAPLEELCTKCHSGADMKGKDRYTRITDVKSDNGPHPVGMTMSYSGLDKVRGEKVTERVFRDRMAPQLRIPVKSPEELSSPAVHWETGGHLTVDNASGTAGRIGCNTCHSAHMPGPSLLVLADADVEHSASPLCNGCHSREDSPANPGGTPYYHPVFSESLPPHATSTPTHRPLTISIPAGWPLGADGALLCTTCHVTHGGVAGQKMIRKNDQGEKHICDVCHLPEGLGTERNSHHAMRKLNYTLPEHGGHKNPSWYLGPGEPGDLADGLSCSDCHTELVKSAHNW